MSIVVPQQVAAMDAAARRILAGRGVSGSCFGPGLQSGFVRSKASLRAAVCTRRAGKSWGVAAWLIEGALICPESCQLYLAITRKSAKRIIWPILKKIDREWGLGCEFKLGDLIVVFPNGSEIHVAGCPDASQVDTFRGTPYFRVAIDEGASFPTNYMGALVDEALVPATIDLGGAVVIIGTPGVAPVGYLWEASTGRSPGWESHHWTLFDNPHLPSARQFVEDLLKRKKWTWEHPTIQREYLGKWTSDPSMLVYGSFSDDLVVDAGPQPGDGPWHYVLGLDFGTSETHETQAYSVVAYSDTVRFAYVVETMGESSATPASVAANVNLLQRRYKFDAIVGDPGSLGADFIAQLRQRYRLPVEAAKKSNKRGFIELINGEMQSGLLRFVRGKADGVVGEMKILPWQDESRTTEKPKMPNHHCDATLYAWRHCRPYDAESVPDPGPLPGTTEHSDEREKQIEAAFVKDARAQKKAPWWKRGR